MFDRFDSAIAQALTSEHSHYGTREHSIATATARHAAAENQVKAMNEATLGHAGFARLHDTASARFHEDAELMSRGQPPIHHAVSFYLATAPTSEKPAVAREAVAKGTGHLGVRAA